MKKLFSLITVVLMSAAYAQAAEPMLAGTEWQLSEVGGMKVEIAENPPFILLTDEENKLKGHSSCNSFMGNYEGTGDALKFGPIAATKMACPDPQAKIEQALMKALADTRSYAIVEGVLHLKNEGGDTVAKFTWTVTEE